MGENLNDLKLSTLKYDGWQQVEKSITFDGATTNAIGDFDGTGDPYDIFSVTGTVLVKLFAVCTTTLTIDATATAEIGTALLDDGLIATTAGDAIDVNEIWHDTTPDSSIELATVAAETIVNQDIIGSTKTANIKTGVIKFICVWRPISIDGNVNAA